jgi:hypothetical protein
LFRKDGLNLRDVIKNSYSPKSELGSYMRDPELSGKRQQVYIEENKQLLFSAGTRSGTERFEIGYGWIEEYYRFKSADKTLKDAKELYPDCYYYRGFKSWW